jgi:hypothetical protein
MSDQPQEIQIPLNFPYIKGNIPAYANTFLITPSPEGVIIDFGFFDPLLAKQLQEEWTGKNIADITKDQPADVQSVGRVFINRVLAEQLIQQVQLVLNNVKQQKEE